MQPGPSQPQAAATVVVSLRSRGIPSVNLSRLWSWRAHAIDLLNEVSDIPAAALITLVNLSWAAWLSIAITILVVAVNISTKTTDPDTSSFFPLFAYVVLPLLLLLYFVMTRRDRAQSALNRFKVAYVALKLQASALSAGGLSPPASQAASPHPGPRSAFANGEATDRSVYPQQSQRTWEAGLVASAPATTQAADSMQRVLLLLLQDLHRYLGHRRPYARHFYIPYTTDRFTSNTLYLVCRELGLLARRLQRAVREVVVVSGCLRDALMTSTPAASSMNGGGLASQHQAGHSAPAVGSCVQAQACGCTQQLAALPTCTLLAQQASELHAAVEELMTLKEQHTPVLIRASVCWFTTIIFPVFLGWYWLLPSRLVNKAVGGIMAVVCQIGLMVLVDTAVSLEDPFDEVALDAVSCVEALDATRRMGDVMEAELEEVGAQLVKDPGQLGAATFTSTAPAAAATSAASPGVAPAAAELWGGGLPATVSLGGGPPMPPMPPPPAPAYLAGNPLATRRA